MGETLLARNLIVTGLNLEACSDFSFTNEKLTTSLVAQQY